MIGYAQVPSEVVKSVCDNYEAAYTESEKAYDSYRDERMRSFEFYIDVWANAAEARRAANIDLAVKYPETALFACDGSQYKSGLKVCKTLLESGSDVLLLDSELLEFVNKWREV